MVADTKSGDRPHCNATPEAKAHAPIRKSTSSSAGGRERVSQTKTIPHTSPTPSPTPMNSGWDEDGSPEATSAGPEERVRGLERDDPDDRRRPIRRRAGGPGRGPRAREVEPTQRDSGGRRHGRGGGGAQHEQEGHAGSSSPASRVAANATAANRTNAAHAPDRARTGGACARSAPARPGRAAARNGSPPIRGPAREAGTAARRCLGSAGAARTGPGRSRAGRKACPSGRGDGARADAHAPWRTTRAPPGGRARSGPAWRRGIPWPPGPRSGSARLRAPEPARRPRRPGRVKTMPVPGASRPVDASAGAGRPRASPCRPGSR